MAPPYETYEHDVLVVGAGGAGLRAAIEALGQGASVGVVCKSLLGKAHTVMAEGGIAAAMANVDRGDDWRTHFRDTMKGGKFLNDWRMAQIHAQESPDRVRELEQWGALFDRTADGEILQRAFGGHTFKRLCHVGDRTGLEMIRTLQDRGVQMGFHVYMECAVTRLLKDGDRICGAVAYWREQGRFVVFRAKSVVLATGGIGKAWRITSNSWEYTGDGMALAYDAGAELLDMEFVQFHPTGMVWPPGVQGILVTEAVRGEGGVLTNRLGERFMQRYDPDKMELSTRDVVARAIYTEVKEGRGTEHGGAFLDISQKPAEYVKRKLPSMYHQFLRARRRGHHEGADGGRPHVSLHDGRRPRRRGDRGDHGARALRRGRGRRGAARSEPAGRQLAFRPPRLRAPRRARRGGERQPRSDGFRRRYAGRRRRSRDARVLRAGRGGEPVRGPSGPGGFDAGPRRHLPQRGGPAARAREDTRALRPRVPRPRGGVAALQPGVAPRAGPEVDADRHRGGRTLGARAEGEPGRAQPHRLPEDRPGVGDPEQRRSAGARRRWR